MMIEKDQTWYNVKTNSVVIVLNHPGNFGDVELSHMSGRKTKNKQHYFKYQYRHCELGVVEEPKQRRKIDMKTREKKHTPGPWRIEKEIEHETWIDTAGSGGICRIHGGEGYRQLNETEKANANLIAAAPELLEALELVMNKRVVQCHCGEEFDDKDYADQARSAIAKAYGE